MCANERHTRTHSPCHHRVHVKCRSESPSSTTPNTPRSHTQTYQPASIISHHDSQLNSTQLLQRVHTVKSQQLKLTTVEAAWQKTVAAGDGTGSLSAVGRCGSFLFMSL